MGRPQTSVVAGAPVRILDAKTDAGVREVGVDGEAGAA
jgi:hypothetical protein